MKKITWILVLLVTLVGMASAQDEYDPDNIVWQCPEEFAGESLSVANWSGYFGFRTLRTFEELCDVEVEFDIYDTNEEMLERLRDSQSVYDYDIVIPTDYIMATLIRERLIQRIDISRIPNYANIGEEWRDTPFDPTNEYSVPYLWGTTSIGYRVDRVEVTPQTWMDFFTHDGPVAWLNDTRTMMSIALRALGFDPNSITTAEIDTAREFLESQASNVYEIANDNGQALLEDGTVDMVIEYNGDIYQLLLDCECEDYAYLIPEEGTIFDLGLLVVPSRAKNPELAIAFIDYLHDPYVNAQIMNDTGYATTNQAALESGFITPALLENPIINPDASILERSWTLEDVGDVDFIYIDAWARLRRELGK